MATSKFLVPEYMAMWAKRKGVAVVGTGDFTHPLWLSELKQKLSDAGNGLFTLLPQFELNQSSVHSQNQLHFMLTAELNCIYKENNKYRKVHHILLAPNFASVEKFNHALSHHSNLQADGRPIVKLSSKHLLELMLNISDEMMLVPAHIWTPWFSVLGSKSGYSNLEECFGELTKYVYAVETGLSSDFAMNRKVDFLNTKTLLSNSDAHSPEKIGRNATIFNTEVSYNGIANAIKQNDNELLAGTIDNFPHEGKYYFDGHRNCNVKFHPNETANQKGVCPICNKKLTIGVFNTINCVSNQSIHSPNQNKVPNIVPLDEILAEIAGVGTNSKMVEKTYIEVTEKLGTELNILLDKPISDIQNTGYEKLAQAIDNMRNQKVSICEGYDGKFGSVKLLQNGAEEKKSIFIPDKIKRKHTNFFELPEKEKVIPNLPLEIELTDEQKSAVEYSKGCTVISGGKFSGKTEVVLRRCARLINSGIAPERILFILPNLKSANYIRQRLSHLIPNHSAANLIEMGALTLICEQFLSEYSDNVGISSNFLIIDNSDKLEILSEIFNCDKLKAQTIAQRISKVKRLFYTVTDLTHSSHKSELRKYERYLKQNQLIDRDDLIFKTYKLLIKNKKILHTFTEKYDWIFIDDYQSFTISAHLLINLLIRSNSKGLTIATRNNAPPNDNTSQQSIENQFTDAYHIFLSKQFGQSEAIQLFHNQMRQKRFLNSRAETEGANGMYLICSHDPDTEAKHIADTIFGHKKMGTSVNVYQNIFDTVIYYRSKTSLIGLTKFLEINNIGYQTFENTPFFEQVPIKSIIQLLKSEIFDTNTFIDSSLHKNKLKHLPRWVEFADMAEDKSVRAKLVKIIDNYFEYQKSQYKQHFQTLLGIADEFGSNVSGFLKYIALSAKTDHVFASDNDVLIIPASNSYNIKSSTSFLCLNSPINFHDLHSNKEIDILTRISGNTLQHLHLLHLANNQTTLQKITTFAQHFPFKLTNLASQKPTSNNLEMKLF